MELRPAEIEWLTTWRLVDDDVDLRKVRPHVGGPMGGYLKVTNHGALTTGYRIWYRTEARRNDIALVAHELVHVGQYRRLGRLRFLLKYLAETARRRGYSREHSLEAPAYARQQQAREVVREHGGPHA